MESEGNRQASPAISVVIPTKNRHGFLRKAIASVLEQSLLPLEIIVVDDGEGAANALAELSDLIRVLDNQHRGPVPARNLGVAAARGEAIAFLDDDDWFSGRDHLQMAAVTIAGGADFTFSDGTMVFEDGSPKEPFAFDADAASLEANNTILISAVTYRRSMHDRLGMFDEAIPYYWDWDWYLRVARGGFMLQRLAQPTVSIRVHAQNMSGPEQELARRRDLDALEAKHGLPPIPLKNHLSLAREKRD